jgi:hypothetical protein
MTDVRATLHQAKEQQGRADFRNAERSLLLALEASAQLYGDPALVAESLQMLSAFYVQTRQIHAAIGQASWALEILKAKLGEGHKGLAPVYRTLAELALQEGDKTAAERYQRLAETVEGNG